MMMRMMRRMRITWTRRIDLAQPPPLLKTVYHVSSLLFLSLFFYFFFAMRTLLYLSLGDGKDLYLHV